MFKRVISLFSKPSLDPEVHWGSQHNFHKDCMNKCFPYIAPSPEHQQEINQGIQDRINERLQSYEYIGSEQMYADLRQWSHDKAHDFNDVAPWDDENGLPAPGFDDQEASADSQEGS
jgi:hypothetical protein